MGYSVLIDSTEGDIFKQIMQELNGHEEALIILANTLANRTLVNSDQDVSIKWGDTEIFLGKLKGAEYFEGTLEAKVYNKCYEVMAKHLITDDYANIAANLILDDILKIATGTTTAPGAVGGSTVIDTNRTESDDFFKGMYLKITSGAQSGQIREITSWVLSTGTFTVSPSFGGTIWNAVTYEVFFVKPGSCPATTVSVQFKKANCLDAARWLALAVNKDHWTTGTEFNIGDKGSSKGSITIVGVPRRGTDRAKQHNHVWVRGFNTDGDMIYGEAKSGGWTAENDDPIVFTDHKAQTTATLDNIASKKLEEIELESCGVKLDVSPDDAYDLHTGDTITLDRPNLKLEGDFRIWKITKQQGVTIVEVDRPEVILERQLDELFNFEEMGIYIPTAVCTASCQTECQVACQTECQPSCQQTCQDGGGCQTACQGTCQTECQPSCQTACQDSAGCQTVCQDTNQTCAASGNCQVACQQTCQQAKACEGGGVCQTACQSGHTCETTCQEECQDSAGCQVACQATCQTECQPGCQTECQDSAGCQVACQASCQTQCQPSCQTACQDSAGCQTECQTSCQIQCQPSCQAACQDSAGCQTECQSSDQTCAKSGNCQVACQTVCQGTATCETVCETMAESTHQPAENYVPNCSFEIDTDANGVPDGWVTGTEAGSPTYFLSVAQQYRGRYSAAIYCSPTSEIGKFISEKMIPVKSGMKYFARVFARATNAHTSGYYFLVISEFDKDSNYLGDKYPSTDQVLPASWKEFSGIITTSANCKYVQVRLFNHTPSVVTTVYFDEPYFGEQKAANPTIRVVGAQGLGYTAAQPVANLTWVEMVSITVGNVDMETLFAQVQLGVGGVSIPHTIWCRIYDSTDGVYYPKDDSGSLIQPRAYVPAWNVNGFYPTSFFITIPKNAKNHVLKIHMRHDVGSTKVCACNVYIYGHSPHIHI